MKITDIKTVLLSGPLTNDPYVETCTRSAAFVEIHTDCEHLGLAETYAGYFFPEGVPPIVEFFKPILIGQDVENIDVLWDRMYHCGNFWCRVGLGTMVLTAIEAALWDLKGKFESKPVYELLGGLQHDKLLGYASGGHRPQTHDAIAEKLDYYMGIGFRAVKTSVHYRYKNESIETDEIADREVADISFMRNHVGKDVELLFDGHMSNLHDEQIVQWDVNIAKTVLKELEPYDIFLFEEPLHYNEMKEYAQLAKSTSIPIAGGECLTHSEWQVFIDHDCFDIAQPDASYLGGLRSFMNISAQYASRNKQIATHAWGAGGSLMQNIHCAFAAKNTCILEIPPSYGPLHSEVMGDRFQMIDGYVLPPHAPGLGIELTNDFKNRFPFKPGSGEFNSVPGKIEQ